MDSIFFNRIKAKIRERLVYLLHLRYTGILKSKIRLSSQLQTNINVTKTGSGNQVTKKNESNEIFKALSCETVRDS